MSGECLCVWNAQLTMNDFSVHRIIGRGGFGEVYGCRKADTGKMSVSSPSALLFLTHNAMQRTLLGVLLVQWLGRQTFDQAVVGSIPGWGIIKAPRSTQPSISPG